MARKFGILTNSAEVALVGTTVKTVLQLATPASIRIVVSGIAIFFDGVAVTNEPVQVELVTQASAGTGTTRNPVLLKPGIEALQCSGKENHSAEPTSPVLIFGFEVHPQSGYEREYPLMKEIELGASSFIGLRCTAPVAVNCRATFYFEE